MNYFYDPDLLKEFFAQQSSDVVDTVRFNFAVRPRDVWRGKLIQAFTFNVAFLNRTTWAERGQVVEVLIHSHQLFWPKKKCFDCRGLGRLRHRSQSGISRCPAT